MQFLEEACVHPLYRAYSWRCTIWSGLTLSVCCFLSLFSVHLLLLFCRKEEPDAKKAKVDEEEDYNLAEISEGNVTSVSR